MADEQQQRAAVVAWVRAQARQAYADDAAFRAAAGPFCLAQTDLEGTTTPKHSTHDHDHDRDDADVNGRGEGSRPASLLPRAPVGPGCSAGAVSGRPQGTAPLANQP